MSEFIEPEIRLESTHDVYITGEYSEMEEKYILDRCKCMMLHHPACLRKESVAFRYNKARVFMVPKKESSRGRRSA